VQSIQRHVAHPGNQQNLLQLWNISWCALSLSLSLLSLFNRVSNLLELFVETFQPWRSERRITGLGRGAQNGSKARCKGTAAFILTSYRLTPCEHFSTITSAPASLFLCLAQWILCKALLCNQ
jgi:hypothetical protein